MGADAIAAGRLMGGAGLNGDRHWGTHFLTSSLPFGFTDYFPEGSGNGRAKHFASRVFSRGATGSYLY
jgi:hypothetical protein